MRNLRLSKICLAILLLGACQQAPDPPAEVEPIEQGPVLYKIAAGQHYSEHEFLRYTEDSTLAFVAIFDTSAIYQTADPSNQVDINKLYGFSDCNESHQQSSARFGWNWKKDSLYIYAYCYRAGERLEQVLGTAELNKPLNYAIRIAGNQYVFRFKGKEVRMPRSCVTTANQKRYYLYPYFGGFEPAPHDIRILIQ